MFLLTSLIDGIRQNHIWIWYVGLIPQHWDIPQYTGTRPWIIPRLIDRHADRQPCRQVDMQTYWTTCKRQEGQLVDRTTGSESDSKTGRQEDRQT
jgi:hypothetical protein